MEEIFKSLHNKDDIICLAVAQVGKPALYVSIIEGDHPEEVLKAAPYLKDYPEIAGQGSGIIFTDSLHQAMVLFNNTTELKNASEGDAVIYVSVHLPNGEHYDNNA